MIVRLQRKACHRNPHGTRSSRPGSYSEHGSSIDILNDFNHAVEQSEDCRPAKVPREGFLPFAPVALLQSGGYYYKKFEQKYYHNLESLLYVFCFICSRYSDPGVPRRYIAYPENITQWHGKPRTSLWDIGLHKVVMVQSAEEFEKTVLRDIRPNLDQIRPCLKKLRVLLSPANRGAVEAFRRTFILNGYNLKDIPFEFTAMEERDPDEFVSNVKKELSDALASLEKGKKRKLGSVDSLELSAAKRRKCKYVQKGEIRRSARIKSMELERMAKSRAANEERVLVERHL